jgi:sugar phosphate isomerase/epimerase
MRTDAPFSVCEFTTPDTTFEEDLGLVALVDAQIGICEARLREGEEEAQAAEMFSRGLKATVCVPNNISPLPCEPAFPGPKEPEVRLDLMRESFRRLAPFKPEVVVVVTGDDHDLDRADARKIGVEGLREAARAAARYGITLSLEPIRRDLGLHISLPTTLAETAEWIEEIGEPNIGICLDTFNVFRTEGMQADAERYAKLINSVHVNDWTDPPRGFSDRTYPGNGILELADIIAALERGGYEGFYDLEIFASDGLEYDGEAALWRKPPEEILKLGRDGFDRAWGAAGAIAG